MTSGNLFYREYWAGFMEYAEEHSKDIKRRKPLPQYWMDFAVGRSNFTLQTVASLQKRYLMVCDTL